MPKRKHRGQYPLNQSPLYKLKNKRKLAALFNRSLDEINNLLANNDNYRVFYIKKEGRRDRKVEAPFPHLERLHRRIFNLMSRITPPPYIFSGVKGRSYVSNAKAHRASQCVYKLDIENFYPSTSSLHVFNFFNKTMKCSRDVAGLLTNITTVDGHIPTGSCLSQILAFYTHITMFEELYQLALGEGLIMTCYVDDIVFSGNTISKRFRYQAKKVIEKNHLKAKSSKERFYFGNRPREITGILISNGQLTVPNRHHQSIKNNLDEILTLNHLSPHWKEKHQSTRGKIISASQVDQAFKPKVEKITQLYKTKSKI